MKKTLLYLLMASIFLNAESLDEEIERLKKENELLELKQKNKQLSQDLQAGKVTNNTTKDNASDNSSIIKISKEESKNGFFIGLEGVIGDFSYQLYTFDQEIRGAYGSTFIVNDEKTTFDGGLLFGWQKYFGQTQRHGIKLSVHLYSGFGYTPQFHKSHYKFFFIPIKVGADLKYLWDFWDNKKHILGFNVGAGYEFDYYFLKTEIMDVKDNAKEYNFINGGFYPTIGLHYVYNRHHQFELNYRFGGILAAITDRPSPSVDAYFGSRTLFSSLLTLNYAYRF